MVLYASGARFNNANQLGNIEVVQFDLTQNDFFENESVVFSFQNPNGAVFVAGALQIGMDKRIYHSFGGNSLSVIRSPNEVARLVDAQRNTIPLGGRMAQFGLPPFVQSFFETIFTIENTCFGDTTTFTPDELDDIASIAWNFGDPNSGVDNTQDAIVGEHVFSAAGDYGVTAVVIFNNGAVRTFLENVTILSVPNVLERATLEQCDIDGADDGLTIFNLNEAIPLFANGETNFETTFFSTQVDAIEAIDPIEPLEYANTMTNEIVFARVSSNSECFSLVAITLIATPVSDLGLYDTFYNCEGLANGNTVTADLTDVVNQLQADFPDNEVTVFANRTDALLSQNPIPIGPFTSKLGEPTQFSFRIEEDDRCAFIGDFIWIVQPTPDFESLVVLELCDGLAELVALPGFNTYEWSNSANTSSI